ncbi:MAG TPA: S8 family serine peptidase [Blastocatellia bacterium]|nr:S8 family serine peptidase [Blastocatellia bacterium]
MKRKTVPVTLAISFAFALQASSGLLGLTKASSVAPGQSFAQSASGTSAGTVTAIVELESQPVVLHQRLTERVPRREIDFESPSASAYESRLDAEHASFKSRAALLSPNVRVRAELRKLANAVSVEVSETELAAIAALPGVKRVELAKEVHATLDTSVPLINAPALWDRLGGIGAAGQGVKIAILDTGIDIANPLFSDAGFTMPDGFPKTNNVSGSLVNNKVIVAKSFLTTGASAADQNGHGSNVAGIAAGSVASSPLGMISGVAPMAYLGNYRVLSASGSGRTDLIAQAIEEAVADGFDVLNMSFGGDADADLDIASRAAENAVASGRVVVIAAGNNGSGAMTVTSPGIAPSAITVAATTNGHLVGPVITVDQPAPVDASLTRIGSASGNAVALDDSLKLMPYVYVDAQGRGCNVLPAGSLSGKAALIERGICAFADKVSNAAAAGARAVIIFNKDSSEGADGGETVINMDVAGTVIPSLFVPRSAGLALRDFAAAHPSATLSISPIGSRAATSDVLAGFSSHGPSSIEELKPDVAAPGVVIYSAAIKNGDPSTGVVDPSGFLAINGTSQATPHVAGSAALLKQLHPLWTPAQIKSALTNSATDVFTSTDKSTRAGVLATGAGRIDLARASSVDATISPASLSFGIKKLKKKDVSLTLDLNITNQLDVQNSFGIAIEQLDPGDGITLTPSTDVAVIPGGQSSTVTITISALRGSERRDYTGYVLITDASQTLRVPYWVRYVKRRS